MNKPTLFFHVYSNNKSMSIAKVCKFQKERKEISYDCGETFIPTSETRKIEGREPVERNSTDCGFQMKFMTIESGYTCNGYDKYTQLVDVVSFNGEDWDVVEGSQRIGTIEEKWSPDCCQLREVTATTCDNRLRKVNASIQEASIDGETWVQTGCYTINELIDDFSIECFREHNLRYYGIIPESEPSKTSGQISPFDFNSYGILYGQNGVVETREKGFYMVTCDSDLIEFYNNAVPSSVPYTLSPIKVYVNCVPYANIYVNRVDADGDEYGEDLLEYVFADSGATGYINIRSGNVVCTQLHTVDLENSTFSSVTVASDVLSALTLPSANTVEHLDVFGGKLTTYNIPSSVTWVGTVGLSYTDGVNDVLESLTIPNNVKYLDGWCFRHHVALKDLSIGSGIEILYDYSFTNCSTLSSVTFSNNLKEIKYDCFDYCDSLTSIGEVSSNSSVEIPNSVYSILYSFNRCSGLTSVTIPNNVRFISGSFGGCENLESITCKSIYPPHVVDRGFIALNNCNVYVPCESLYSYKSARGWKEIANRIYPIESSCTPTPYKNYKYEWSDGVNSYTKACDGNTTISGNNGADGELTIGDCVHIIGRGAFSGNTALTSVEISKTVDTIDNYAFRACTSLSSVTIPDNVVGIYSYVFEECTSLTSVTMPKVVELIGEGVFYGCTNLRNVTMPEYIIYDMSSSRRIQKYMFSGCTSLTSVTMPSNITRIDESAFNHCHSLSSITIPESVTSIGNYAFARCYSFTSVTIPAAVTDIGFSAFQYCSGLTSVTCLAIEPPVLGGTTVFGQTNNCPIYVPSESVDIYKSSWGVYADRIQAIS